MAKEDLFAFFISIPAPARGATYLLLSPRRMPKFQFPPLREGRPAGSTVETGST